MEPRLQIDVEGPEMSENQTQSYMHIIIQAHTAFGHDILDYIIDVYILYYMI